MGLESRGGRLYYYRKVWDRGRVRSEYVGGGLLAVMAAQWNKRTVKRKRPAR